MSRRSAPETLAEHGGLAGLARVAPEELARRAGIGTPKPQPSRPPWNSPSPSPEDVAATRRIQGAAPLVGSSSSTT